MPQLVVSAKFLEKRTEKETQRFTMHRQHSTPPPDATLTQCVLYILDWAGTPALNIIAHRHRFSNVWCNIPNMQMYSQLHD